MPSKVSGVLQSESEPLTLLRLVFSETQWVFPIIRLITGGGQKGTYLLSYLLKFLFKITRENDFSLWSKQTFDFEKVAVLWLGYNNFIWKISLLRWGARCLFPLSIGNVHSNCRGNYQHYDYDKDTKMWNVVNWMWQNWKINCTPFQPFLLSDVPT